LLSAAIQEPHFCKPAAKDTFMQKLNRRAMLGALAAGTTMVISSANAAAKQTFFKRIGRPIGLQLYTLGDAARHDLDKVFADVARIGYRDIEMPELYGHSPAEISAAAARAGLAITSLHVASSPLFNKVEATLSGDLGKLVDEMGTLGVKQAVLPILTWPEGFMPRSIENFGQDLLKAITAAGPDHWKRNGAFLNEKAAALKPHGISLSYHNHNIEFAPIGNETGWSILKRETDPGLIHFEVDVGWVAAAGIDPVAFLEGLKGRVRQLHVKDLLAATSKNVTIGMSPAEVGSGKLDWARLLPAAHRAGVRNYYVEQEPPFTIPRMEAAAKSFAYLASLRA
jgi:sugar phosphate isomerase/epimerase